MNSGGVFNRIISFVYPNRCGFCGEIIRYDKLVCAACAGRVEREISESKSKRPIYLKYGQANFDGCFSAGSYDGLMRDGVLRLKYKYGENAAKYLCTELSEMIRSCGADKECDLITFVPMNRRRKRKLGYNQAEIIAKNLSRELRIPIKRSLIRKKGTRLSQHEQTIDGRFQLAKRVYSRGFSRCDLTGRIVLLCDDIVTSGSTLSECARILRSMGALRVYCAVLAQVAETEENKDIKG